jgi:hypothetical protein
VHRVSSIAPGPRAEQSPVPAPRLGYLTPKQAAEFTNISHQELERLRRAGGGPDFCPVGPRLIRYAVEDLCAWLDAAKVNNNSQAYERGLSAGRAVARA